MNDNRIILVTVLGALVLLAIGGFVAVRLASPEPKVSTISSVAGPSAAMEPTQTATPPTTRQIRQPKEFEHLRAENERLKLRVQQQEQLVGQQRRELRDLQRQIQEHGAFQAGAATRHRPTVGRIAGAVWLTKNDTTSNVMRGMPIVLLRTEIDSGPILETLRPQPARWRSLAENYREMIREGKESIATLTQQIPLNKNNQQALDSIQNDITEEQRRVTEYEQIVGEYESKAASIGAFIRAAPQALDAAHAYEVIKAASTGDPILRLPLRDDMIIQKTTTDVNGKYMLEDVSADDYYVFAFFESSSTCVEWLVPARVQSGAQIELDLHNDNAATIRD